MAAEAIAAARLALLERKQNAGAMVFHVDPVAHVRALAVDRQRLAGESAMDHMRDELLRKLERAVVVGAAGGDCAHPVGVMPGRYEMVGGGLRGGIGRAGIEGGALGELTLVAERAEHLVGGNLEEAEGG